MRTNDFFLVAAAASVMMLAACTHDDGTLSTASPASNEIVITTRSSDIGFTRAESDIQSTQFLNGEHIDIFLRDASGVADSTTYGNPYNYQTNGSGGGILTRDGSTVVKEYWPKLMHHLYIYGIYPQGAVGWSKRKTSCADENTYKSENKAYDKDFRYYFIVAEDQTSEADYKNSDLMTGLPSGYDVHAASYTAPFKLTQNENPGTIPLTFTHRLTKIIVNITKTSETADISMDDIKYSGESDKVFARVTLLNTKRKTWFQLYGASSADVVAATRVDVGDEGVDAQPTPTTVIVGQGATALSNNASSVTLSAIVPPQTITSGSDFIQVELIDNTNNANPTDPDNVTNTFKYKLDDNLTLQASKVHTYNIRINKPNITVTTSITNWDAVDAVNPVGVLQ